MSRSPWALLGDIEFELATGPRSFSHSEKSSYSEHEVLDGKPTLQWNGEELETISLDFCWHYAWCDPDEQILRLREARAAHQPLTLILGDGTYQGSWVIEGIDDKLIQTDSQGRTETLEVAVKLKETVEVATQEKQQKTLAVSTGGLAAFARRASRAI